MICLKGETAPAKRTHFCNHKGPCFGTAFKVDRISPKIPESLPENAQVPPHICLTGWHRNRTGTGNRNRQNHSSGTESRAGSIRIALREPKLEAETESYRSMPLSYAGKHQLDLSTEEPSEPNIGNARTFPRLNRNQASEVAA